MYIEQLWKYDDTRHLLINKDGDWKYMNRTWRIPKEGETGTIEGMEDFQGLGFKNYSFGIKTRDVILEIPSNKSTTQKQMWYRSNTTSSGFFAFKYPEKDLFMTNNRRNYYFRFEK